MDVNLAEDPHAKKILGVRNYRSDKKEFSVFDFADIDVLESFLEEVSTGESDITPAGKSFLEKHYGLNNLSELLHRRGVAHRFVHKGDSPAEREKESNLGWRGRITFRDSLPRREFRFTTASLRSRIFHVLGPCDALGRFFLTLAGIEQWLKNLEPMGTRAFIEEARGNIKPGAKLRADLLPPGE
jgi:hypothetical protein